MKMVDHILTFADEAVAVAALAPLGFASQDAQGAWRWNAGRVNPGLAIITADAIWDHSGEHPTIATPEQVLPGFWVAIALPANSPERTALTDMEACCLVADREAAAAGQQFILYMGAAVDPQIVATARVAPVFAGSAYPFGP